MTASLIDQYVYGCPSGLDSGSTPIKPAIVLSLNTVLVISNLRITFCPAPLALQAVLGRGVSHAQTSGLFV
jgi:hypothetical protein